MQASAPGTGTPSIVGIVKGIVATEGVGGMWKGLTAGLLRQVMYGTTRFGVFQTLCDRYNQRGQPLPVYQKFAFGIASGAVGGVVGNPAEVALVRMAGDAALPAAQRRNYANGLSALARIAREEGVAALWTGWVPTVQRAMVVNGAQLGTYATVSALFGCMRQKG